jgi:hypothetical protein
VVEATVQSSNKGAPDAPDSVAPVQESTGPKIGEVLGVYELVAHMRHGGSVTRPVIVSGNEIRVAESADQPDPQKALRSIPGHRIQRSAIDPDGRARRRI